MRDRLATLLVLLVFLVPVLALIIALVGIGIEMGALPVVAIFVSAAVMTWVSEKGQPDLHAAYARVTAAGPWEGCVRATTVDTGKRGYLTHSADRIGFFSADDTEDFIIERSAISLIDAIGDHETGQHRLLITWITDRIRTRSFHAGPDLSGFTGEPTPKVEPLPRATAKLRDDEN